MKIVDMSDETFSQFLVSFESEELSTEETKALLKLQSAAKIAGHEKGQAPIELINKLFRNQITTSAGETLLAKALGKVAENQPPNIKPVLDTAYCQTPTKKYSGIKKDDGSLEFLVKWEKPSQVPITNIVCEVEVKTEDRDQMIENQLEILKLQSGELIPVDRPAIETDYVSCRIEIYSTDNELIAAYPNQTINNRLKESFFGEKVAEAVLGAKKGDKLTVNKYFSPNYKYVPLRDVNAVISIEVNEVFENKIPELNDEFAQKIGHSDLAALKEAIGKQWDLVAKKRKDKAVREQILEVLIRSNPFEMDAKLFEEHLKYAQEEVAESTGLSFAELLKNLPDEKDKEKVIASAKKTAEMNTRWVQLMRAVMAQFPKETSLTQQDLLRYAGEGNTGNSPESELEVIKNSNTYQSWLRNKRYTKAYEYVKSLAVVKEVAQTEMVDFTQEKSVLDEV